MSILTLKDATIKFGGLTAVNSVSFELNKGDLFGLIGPNGAGKTTCFNIITGVYEPTSGEILFNGKRITGTPSNKIAHPLRSISIGSAICSGGSKAISCSSGSSACRRSRCRPCSISAKCLSAWTPMKRCSPKRRKI